MTIRICKSKSMLVLILWTLMLALADYILLGIYQVQGASYNLDLCPTSAANRVVMLFPGFLSAGTGVAQCIREYWNMSSKSRVHTVEPTAVVEPIDLEQASSPMSEDEPEPAAPQEVKPAKAKLKEKLKKTAAADMQSCIAVE
jgi:hypothetical protein